MFSNLLDLTETTDGQYRAPPPPDKGERIFGGQFLAQSMRAAELTVPDDRQVHSLHAYFLRPGDVDHPIELKVDTVRDGRTFSARQVIAHQHDKERFRVTLSFHVNDYCPEFIGATMPDVPSPEEVSFTYDDFTLELIDDDEWPGSARPLEIRYINPPRIRGEATSAPQLMWMRIAETLGDAPGEHLAGLAYLSDSTLVDHIRLPHGKRWQDDDFEGASRTSDSRVRAWTMPCGFTGLAEPISGCSSNSRFSPRVWGAVSCWAVSSTVPGKSWRAACKKGSCGGSPRSGPNLCRPPEPMGHLHRAYESQLRVRSLAGTGPYRSLLGRRTVTPMWVLLVPIDAPSTLDAARAD